MHIGLLLMNKRRRNGPSFLCDNFASLSTKEEERFSLSRNGGIHGESHERTFGRALGESEDTTGKRLENLHVVNLHGSNQAQQHIRVAHGTERCGDASTLGMFFESKKGKIVVGVFPSNAPDCYVQIQVRILVVKSITRDNVWNKTQLTCSHKLPLALSCRIATWNTVGSGMK